MEITHACRAPGDIRDRGGDVARGGLLLLTGVIFGKLGAEAEPIAFYRELEQDEAFRAPHRWRELDVGTFDALFLAGGTRQECGSTLAAPWCTGWLVSSGGWSAR